MSTEDIYETPKREFTGAWIPKCIWTHPDLSWMERCLWAEINNLEGENGCWASNQHLAKMMGSTPSSIANMISKLRQLNLLVDTGFDGRRRYIRAISASSGFTQRLSQGSPTGEGRLNPQVNKDTYRDTSIEVHPYPQEGMDGRADDSECPSWLFEEAKEAPKSDLPKAKELHPLRKRLILLFQKSIRTEIRDSAEDRAWSKIEGRVTEADVEAVEAFYKAKKSERHDITWNRKTAPTQLFNQWTTQVEFAYEYRDQQRAKMPTPKAEEIAGPKGWEAAAERMAARLPETTADALRNYVKGGWAFMPSYVREDILEALRDSGSSVTSEDSGIDIE